MVDKLEGSWSSRGYWRRKAKRIAWFLGHDASTFNESFLRGKGSVSYCKNCYKYMEDYYRPYYLIPADKPNKNYVIYGDILHFKCEKSLRNKPIMEASK